ncbi:cell wall-binding repeat-containing protein [Halobacillus salinarum]|uniref:Cell wall-binding repeat-containing protein n=1 Tax=Halobacillus salinarum TaxID=2932257 RepID=A0ABY4ENY5_9BACI|nr:cell wall-binding repeat-containing protein [Halobacillus salinarum]UOQ45695.1 cell wall-binding repeat-containing protein [Halobacillus salinarum]
MLKPLATVASAGAIALAVFGAPGHQVEAADNFDLTVMHTNDTHAHLTNVPRQVTAVQDIRNNRENTLLLSAGDVFSGTLFYNQYKGLADVEFMNMLKYDAMVPGNHEFDDGPGQFADFIKEAKFPIISSNIDYSENDKLNPLYKDEMGMPGDGGNIYPASIMEVNGEKVGVFGLTTEETKILSSPGETIQFEDYKKKAQETVDMLEKQGVNKIIALTHLGVNYDKDLAQNVEGIDIVVGGHSHTELDKALEFNTDSEPTIVVQAEEYLDYLGDLQVTFDDEGVLTDWNEKLVDLSADAEPAIEADQEAADRLAELEAPIDDMKKKVVGDTKTALDGERNDVRQEETNLGNLIADSMLDKAKEADPDTTIALQNSGGIRASINQGEVTLGEVLTVMPFGNTLVTLDVTGEQLMSALENSVSDYDNIAGRFAQVAGMKYTFDLSKDVGNRIVDAKVKTEDGYEAIDPDKTYTVATNNFVADGGDGYTSFKEAKEAGKLNNLGFVDYEVFTEYLDENNPVNPMVEGRVVQKMNERINGKDRMETAIEISKQGWDKADTVVLARGDKFADALAGAPLAYKMDAPILLTNTDYLNKKVSDEIKRLGASKVVILGGTGAVADYVKYQLDGMGVDVDRIYGNTRYKTAASIAARLDGNPEKVIVADGTDFPDALAAAPYAAKNGYPILLTKPNQLPHITSIALKDYEKSVVVGGPTAVSDSVMGMLPEPMRYNGKNRFETAQVIADELAPKTGKSFIATGDEFADALAGSVLAAKEDASILLVKENKIPEATMEAIDELNIQNFHVLGGPGAVSEKVQDELDN